MKARSPSAARKAGKPKKTTGGKVSAAAPNSRRPGSRIGAAHPARVSFHSGLEFSPAQLAVAMNRGFEGYVVPVDLSPDLFDARFRQVSVDLAASRVPVAAGGPVGLCLISRRGWNSYVAAVGVAPEHRGTGMARELLLECIGESRARGERRMLLEVIDSNERAIRLYQRLGFVVTRRQVGYSHSGDPAALGSGAGKDPGEDLVEIDPLEFARETGREGDADLPWMLSPESLAALAPPTLAFRMGQDARALILPAPGRICSLRGILVRGGARRRGLGTALLRRLMDAHPGRAWKVPQIVPEELAPGFFKNRGFQLDPIAQLEMQLDLGAP